MTAIVDLYQHKLKSMSDDQIKMESLAHATTMERGNLSKIEKIRAEQCFVEAVTRDTLEAEREIFKAALRVLRLF